MVFADEEGVPQRGLTPVGPVTDVMGVGKAESTAREATSPVPGFQSPSQGWGYGAGSAPHVEDGVVRGVIDPDKACVAGEPPGRFSCYAEFWTMRSWADGVWPSVF